MLAQNTLRCGVKEGWGRYGWQLRAIGAYLVRFACIQVENLNVFRMSVHTSSFSPQVQEQLVVCASIGWMYFGPLDRLCTDVPCLRCYTAIENSLLINISTSAIVARLAILPLTLCSCSSRATDHPGGSR